MNGKLSYAATLCVASVLLLPSVGLSQDQTKNKSATKPSPDDILPEDTGPRQKEAKKSAPSSLEEAMEQALKHNADILYATAKVREAEAELHRVQQQVLSKLLALQADVNAAKDLSQEAAQRYAKYTELAQSKLLAVFDLAEAKMAVAKYKADLDRKEAELASLIGKLPTFTRRVNLNTASEAVMTSIAAVKPDTPSFLRAYVVPMEQAETIAKLLKKFYTDSPTVRISSIGTKQLLVFAPATVQNDIKEILSNDVKELIAAIDHQSLLERVASQQAAVPRLVTGDDTENLLKALQLPVSISFDAEVPIKQVLSILHEPLAKYGINLLVEDDKVKGFGKLKEIKFPAIKLSEKIPLAAAIQLIEEKTPIRFVVRDYGIVPMTLLQIPPDAYLLNRFIHPETDADRQSKEKSK